MTKPRILLLMLFAFTNICRAQLSGKEISILKADLVKAVENAKLTDSLYNKLAKLKDKSALIIAYSGTLEALKAKHSWSPYNKIKYVKASLKTLEKAIDMDRENMEIRFMRFSIEHYTPRFLGFSKDLDTDRKELIKHYKNRNFGIADAEMVKNIAVFLINSKRCTAEEVKVLKKFS